METRKLIKFNQGTIYVSLPKEALKALDLEPGDQVGVQLNDHNRLIEIVPLNVTPK